MTADFQRRLRRIGDQRSLRNHPLHRELVEGALSPAALRSWVTSEFALASSELRADAPETLEAWLDLAQAVGEDRAATLLGERTLPAVGEACGLLLESMQAATPLDAISGSLTDLFLAERRAESAASFEKHPGWVDPKARTALADLGQRADRRASAALDFVEAHATSDGLRGGCVAALEQRFEIHRSVFDAVSKANAHLRLSGAAQRRADPVDGRPMVVLPERAVRLNPSGDEILTLCDGSRSALDVASELQNRHPEVARLEEDVHAFLSEMEGLGVLERRVSSS